MRDAPPGQVKIDSKTFPITDINESGVVIDDFGGDLVPKQRIYFDLVLPVGEKEEAFRCEALIVKLEKGRLVAKYLDLRPDAKRAIRVLMAHRQAAHIPVPAPRASRA